MLDDFKPIVLGTPLEQNEAVVYFLHDWHYGSQQFDSRKWRAAKEEILSAPNHYAVIIGDMMENAVPGSKSDVFTQTASPQAQKEWVTEQLIDLKGHIIGGTDGNHERNRSTANCGLHPLYDAFLLAGIGELYRPHFCLIDLGVGQRRPGEKKQQRFIIFVQHKARDNKAYNSADFIEGIDIFAFGHDHTPKDQPRGRLSYDGTRKLLTQRSVETINCGSGLKYGGYAVDGAYRPSSDKAYKARLSFNSDGKVIETIGFYW